MPELDAVASFFNGRTEEWKTEEGPPLIELADIARRKPTVIKAASTMPF